MEENEKIGRTDSNQPTKDISENIGISGEKPAVKRTMPGQRAVRRRIPGEQPAERRIPGEQPAERRISGEQPAERRLTGSQGVRRRAAEDAGTVRQRTAEDAGTARRRRLEDAGAARRRRPEGSDAPTRSRQRRPSGRGRQARRRQSRRRRKITLILKMCLFVILLIAAVVGAFLWKKYSPSKEKADLEEYYGIEEEGQLAITINNEITEPHGMISEGKAYIQYETVRDHISNRFYWDPNENKLLYTLPKDIVTVEVGSKDYMVSNDKNSEDYVILKTEGSTAYIALDFIQQYTNIDFAVYDKPSRVMIVSDWGETPVAQVKKNTQVRYRGGVKSPVLSEVSKKDEVVVLEEEENWKKVRTKDGFIGYVKSSALKDTEKKKITRDFDEPKYTNISHDYTINLVWHNVTNREANNNVLDKIASTKGLTTIAPTWYHVKNTDGDLESLSSSDYVEKARQLKVDVWATVRDFDGGINSQSETYELLSSTSKREKLINQLISDALQTNIAGINVDFEKVSEECGEHYIQFIRELSVKCRQSALVLSVDNYVPKDYNMQYNRKEQGIVADYIIIMGYDEHYAGSPVAGPVSSYNFVKEGIEETLKEVPANKVISGIPFFTRLWEEVPKTEEELANQAGTEEAQYTTKVTSQAFDMNTAKAKLAEAGIETTWDENAQQNYATWVVESATFEMWLEDERSIEPKLKLMKDNKLAGTAAWALGYENGEIWNLIQKYVN